MANGRRKKDEKRKKRGTRPVREFEPVPLTPGFSRSLSAVDPQTQAFFDRFFSQPNPFSVGASPSMGGPLATPSAQTPPTTVAPETGGVQPNLLLKAITPGVERVRQTVLGPVNDLRQRADVVKENIRETVVPEALQGGMGVGDISETIDENMQGVRGMAQRVRSGAAEALNPDLADPTHARETAREIFGEGSLRTLLGRMITARFAPQLAQQLTSVGLEGLESPQARQAAAQQLSNLQKAQDLAGVNLEQARQLPGALRDQAALEGQTAALTGVPGSNATGRQLGAVGAAATGRELRRAGQVREGIAGTGSAARQEAQINLQERSQALEEAMAEHSVNLSERKFNLENNAQVFAQNMGVEDLRNEHRRLALLANQQKLDRENMNLQASLSLARLKQNADFFKQKSEASRAAAIQDMVLSMGVEPGAAMQFAEWTLGNIDTLDKKAQAELAKAYNASVMAKTGGGAGRVETLLDQINTITSSMSRVEKMIANKEIPTDQGERMVSHMSQLQKSLQDRLNLVASGGPTLPQGPGADATGGGGPSAAENVLFGGEFAPTGAGVAAPFIQLFSRPTDYLRETSEMLGQGIVDTVGAVTSPITTPIGETLGFGESSIQPGDVTKELLRGRFDPNGALSTEAFNRLVGAERRRRDR